MTPERLKELERNLRRSERGDGTFGPAVDDIVQEMEKMLEKLTEARFSSVAFLGRATRAEAAHAELAVMQDLYERCKTDRDAAQAQAALFRQSWLDYRDRYEALRCKVGSA